MMVRSTFLYTLPAYAGDVRRETRDVRPDVRPADVRAAPVSSEAKKKNAGGPGGGSPPAKPVKGGVWGGEAPPAKIRGVWGAAPPSQNFFEKSKNRGGIRSRNTPKKILF